MNSYTNDFVNAFKYKIKNNSNELINAYINKNIFIFTQISEEFETIESINTIELERDFCNSLIQMFYANQNNEFESGKKLYLSLKDLSPRDASNAGFWTRLAHNELYQYIHARWPVDNYINEIEKLGTHILYHWHLETEAQASLIDHPLAGLWWSFYMTEDIIDNSDFELTKIFFINSAFRTKYLGQSKIARHKEALIGTLKFIRNNNLHLNNLEENARAITPFLNLLGGTKPLSFFDRDWFYMQLKKKFQKDIEKYGRLFRRDERPN